MSDFALPSSFDVTVESAAALYALDEAKFLSILKTADTVNVKTQEGAWRKEFHLPNSKELDGKKIVFKSTVPAAWDPVIFYGDRKATMKRGFSLVFVNYEGVWVYGGDIELSQVKYGENFWSASIPAEYIEAGMSLRFSYAGTDRDSTTGMLNDIKVGAPTELLLHTIDIGMLTENQGGFTFQETDEYARQYFHTIPTSRLVVSTYEPVYLKEVMTREGVLLKERAPDNGGWQAGSLRDWTATNLIALGIYAANHGANVTDVEWEVFRGPSFSAAQISAFLSIGMYQNGPVAHGGSGGYNRTLVTKGQDLGTEWTHEIGHNFNLWHYAGGFKRWAHQPADEVNSTWGWDSDNNFFLPNFMVPKSDKPLCYTDRNKVERCQESTFSGYTFGTTPMSSGVAHLPQYNTYGVFSPFDASLIQKYLEGKAVFSETSPTGFMKWDSDSQTMREWEHRVPVKTIVDVNPGDVSEDVSEDTIAIKLAQYGGVKMHLWSYNATWHWAKNVYIPAASAENAGDLVKIKHTAEAPTSLHINGGIVQLTKGSDKTYESDGKTWAEITALTEWSGGLEPRKPIRFGVPVTTIVGYFDPEKELQSYIFPALYGSYGMVYPDDKLPSTRLPNECHLEVTTVNGLKTFELADHRFVRTRMNQFQVNIETSSKPSRAAVICGNDTVHSRVLEGPKKEKLNTHVIPRPQ
ncbi:M66 family metalloprotease, partial [Veronia pacifica]|uniref:M66 family metalloprotease n=2 Tax=Veronia pacifica TaxID=1080227 RepID=UPI00363378F0